MESRDVEFQRKFRRPSRRNQIYLKTEQTKTVPNCYRSERYNLELADIKDRKEVNWSRSYCDNSENIDNDMTISQKLNTYKSVRSFATQTDCQFSPTDNICWYKKSNNKECEVDNIIKEENNKCADEVLEFKGKCNENPEIQKDVIYYVIEPNRMYLLSDKKDLHEFKKKEVVYLRMPEDADRIEKIKNLVSKKKALDKQELEQKENHNHQKYYENFPDKKNEIKMFDEIDKNEFIEKDGMKNGLINFPSRSQEVEDHKGSKFSMYLKCPSPDRSNNYLNQVSNLENINSNYKEIYEDNYNGGTKYNFDLKNSAVSEGRVNALSSWHTKQHDVDKYFSADFLNSGAANTSVHNKTFKDLADENKEAIRGERIADIFAKKTTEENFMRTNKFDTKPKRRSEPLYRDKINDNSFEERLNRSCLNTSSQSLNDSLNEDLTECDEEYVEWIKDISIKENIKVKIEERYQDLFTLSSRYSLAHCVAADLNMGSGIAVKFKQNFNNVSKLMDQNQKQGGLAILEDNGRYIYYMVTKTRSHEKPTYYTFWQSLIKLKEHILDNRVKKLGIPTLGCGLDRLKWYKIKSMIKYVFQDVRLEIVVCLLQQDQATSSPSSCDKLRLPKKSNVMYTDYSLSNIDRGTIIIYFSTIDGYITKDMEELSKKYNFLPYFQRSKKVLGEVIEYVTADKRYAIFGCIVRKCMEKTFSYHNLKLCLNHIAKFNSKEKYNYVAFQKITDDNDCLINEKIINLLRNSLKYVDIYCCSN